MRRLELGFVLGLAMFGAACASGRWVPYAEPRVAVAGDGREAYERALGAARAAGYPVLEQDDARGFFRTAARLDRDAVRSPWGRRGVQVRVTYFHVQALSDGSIRVTPSGYHVRDDEGHVMHRELAEELAAFTARIRAAGANVAPAGIEPTPPLAVPPPDATPPTPPL